MWIIHQHLHFYFAKDTNFFVNNGIYEQENL